MTRLVFSGVLERWPDLKFITHHAGGMIPFYEERITAFHALGEMQYGDKHTIGLTKAWLKSQSQAFCFVNLTRKLYSIKTEALNAKSRGTILDRHGGVAYRLSCVRTSSSSNPTSALHCLISSCFHRA